jgi:hypothetical protein
MMQRGGIAAGDKKLILFLLHLGNQFAQACGHAGRSFTAAADSARLSGIMPYICMEKEMSWVEPVTYRERPARAADTSRMATSESSVAILRIRIAASCLTIKEYGRNHTAKPA